MNSCLSTNEWASANSIKTWSNKDIRIVIYMKMESFVKLMWSSMHNFTIVRKLKKKKKNTFKEKEMAPLNMVSRKA